MQMMYKEGMPVTHDKWARHTEHVGLTHDMQAYCTEGLTKKLRFLYQQSFKNCQNCPL